MRTSSRWTHSAVPTVVEFAIATPRPYGHGTIMSMADDLRDGLIDEDEIDLD